MLRPAHPAEPFFLGGGPAARFCLYHAPAGNCRGAWVYLHPFAEEMNKSRRMSAIQARQLAAQGYAVLQIDLHGCGDSAGDIADASWESWLDDAARAASWLQHRLGPDLPPSQLGFWGLRLGGLLAISAAVRHSAAAPLLLVQPVLSGGPFLNQFLRLKVANQLLDGSGGPRSGTADLRAQLTEKGTLEIAGYEISECLANALESATASAATPQGPVYWIEIVAEEGRGLMPASRRIIDQWQTQGTAVAAATAVGPQFWATQEIEDCPDLPGAIAQLLAPAFA